jgi:hypothetical protein
VEISKRGKIIFSIYIITMFEQTLGSKAQVWHGTAKKTSGGLTKSHLMKNKHGHIVSKKQHKRGKSAIKHLFKLGFKPKKGTFKAFHKGHKGSKKMRGGTGSAVGTGNLGSPLDRALVAAGGSRRSRSMRGGVGRPVGLGNLGAPLDRALVAAGGSRRSRSMMGGMAYGGPLSPLAYDGKGVGTSGVDLQFVAGNAA